MIFSMIFLFLVLICAAAVIYYLYAFFIPALKLKNKDYNELLASNFNFDDDFAQKNYEFNVLSPKEKADDAVFDSIYRSDIKDEKIFIGFTENESDENNLEKKSRKPSICFKFWIFCYKLLRTRFGESFN